MVSKSEEGTNRVSPAAVAGSLAGARGAATPRLEQIVPKKIPGYAVRAWRRFRRNKLSLVALFLARLVDVLQRLKGQDCSADFAGFAVPHQFDFALVLEQQEAVLLRQRLASLDQLDQVALFGV